MVQVFFFVKHIFLTNNKYQQKRSDQFQSETFQQNLSVETFYIASYNLNFCVASKCVMLGLATTEIKICYDSLKNINFTNRM